MARKSTNTADYFPHEAKSGKTLFLLESKYGNDGYAFLFKLLEILCNSEGHYFDLRIEDDREFLLAKTRVDISTADNILNDLSKWKKIDPELWNTYKVVWSQSLVDNLKDLYQKRKRERPSRPCFSPRNNTAVNVTESEMPQSRVEESKVKESIGEESEPSHEILNQEKNFQIQEMKEEDYDKANSVGTEKPERRYQVGEKVFYNIEKYFEEKFQLTANALKMKYGALKIKDWIEEFSVLHNEKTWKDEQDFRHHISSFFLVQADKKQFVKNINVEKSNQDLTPEELQRKYAVTE